MIKLVEHSLANVHPFFDEEQGQVVRRWVLLLPGSGCQWYKDSQGGCTMCALPLAAQKFSFGKLLPPYIFQMLYSVGNKMVTPSKPERIDIFNGGNFICDTEIPLLAQRWLCDQVGKHPTIRKMMVESLPQYVTDDKLSDLLPRLQGKTMEIGIGLEVYSDRIRAHNVRKNFGRKQFERAVRVMQQHGVKLWVYVFLKPLGLNESASIDEAIQAIKYSAELGAEEIALECAFVQDRTKMGEAYKAGEFKPPWLWSILQVLEQTRAFARVHVGGFTDDPEPIAIPQNCQICSPRLYPLFEDYRKIHDLDSLLSSVQECSCKEKWQNELSWAF